MYSVSSAYREAIQLHRTQGVRNRFYAQVYIGQFDSAARGDATLTINDGGADFSDFGSVNTDAVQAVAYASWEGDFLRLDGAQRFLPERADERGEQGFVSARISDAEGNFAEPVVLTIDFTQIHRMSGVTLLFDDASDAYVSRFTIDTYLNGEPVETHEVENDAAKYEGVLTLTEHNKMVITFRATARPYQRLRLQHLLFGIGFVYGNAEIMELSYKRSASPVSLELPSSKPGFSLYNEGGIFTPDSTSSILTFFSQDQECRIMLGYDVSGDGAVEWIGTGKFWLSEWTADGITAKFTAADVIERMSAGTYRRGVYGSHTARWLIEDVMADFGYDNYDARAHELEETVLQNPLPLVSHAQCLQLIANCAMCTLETDADGRIVFRSRAAATPSSGTPLEPEALLPGSDAEHLTDPETEAVEYASWERDGFALSGNMRFVPDGGQEFLGFGLGWDMLPQADGSYEDVPGVLFEFAENVTFGSAVLDFGENFLPPAVRLRGLRDDGAGGYDVVYEREWQIVSAHSVFVDNFDRIVRLQLTVPRNTKAQRPRIRRVAFSWENGYEITTADIFGNPKGKKLVNCRNLIVLLDNRTAEDSDEIKTVTIPAGEETWIEHGGMYRDVTAAATTSGAVLDYTPYAYATRVTAAGATGDVEVVLTGKKLAEGAEDARTVPVNTSGEDCTIENPLLSAASLRPGYLDWMKAYFAKGVEWSAETLGYPELTAGDLIGYKGMQATVLEANLTYKYSLKEQFTLRKEETS